jgi:hypothetical protein
VLYSTDIQTVYSTETTAIAASAGFIPIESSFPGSQKRAVAHEEGTLEKRQQKNSIDYQIAIKNDKPVASPAMYPQGVVCAGLVAAITTTVRTKTASKTAIRTATTPTVTITNKATATYTTTSIPVRASTFVTQTVQVTVEVLNTITTTKTIFQSQTVTIAAPQATFYAACADNNIITQANGRGFSGARIHGTTSSTGAASAYDCCVVCLNTAKCGSSAFSNRMCFLNLQSESVCSQQNLGFEIFLGNTDALGFSFSNGYCGHASLQSGA